MRRCGLCPGVNHCIGPDGPDDAEVVFIGEAPGKRENEKGKVFIGPTGQEVDEHYLPLAGLRREDVSFTNAIRCLPASTDGKLDTKKKGDIALLESCAHSHLYPLLRKRVSGGRAPRVLVPMGAFACKAICPEVDLDLQHGIPTMTEWGIPAFPMRHPARGIHEPKKMLDIRTDFYRLGQYLKGNLHVPTDDYEGQEDYAEATQGDVSYIDPTRPLAGDTETQRGGEPFCLTYTQEPGVGRLIRADNLDLLAKFQGKAEKWESEILFHNWFFDWVATEAMAIEFPYRRVVDTQSLVFHLGNLPQGLKALAFRECGMRMQDFEDLVSPYSTQMVLNYFRKAQMFEWPKPEPCMVIEKGAWKVYSPQRVSTKLKRFFTDFSKNEEKDVFKMWTKNWVDHQEEITEKVGEYPGMCITHVPFEKVLYYACRDVDALIRARPIIMRMRARVRKANQERWRV